MKTSTTADDTGARQSATLFRGFAALFLLGLLTSPLSAELVGHYRLDGNGTNSSDSGRHGAVVGAIAASDRSGNPGGALAFDGIDDHVDIDQLLFDGDDMTIAFWAKSSGAQNRYAVMVS